MTAVTYNLTKLFQMKLKATKCYLSHLIEKTKRTFWPTKQPGKANQRSKEVSLPSGQKGHAEKSVQHCN